METFEMTTGNQWNHREPARRPAGLHIDMADLMIGAICTLAGATLATRNVRDFDATGPTIVDP